MEQIDAKSIDRGLLYAAEKENILRTLAKHHGNRTHAAKTLGISVRTIRNKLREYREADGYGRLRGDGISESSYDEHLDLLSRRSAEAEAELAGFITANTTDDHGRRYVQDYLQACYEQGFAAAKAKLERR